MTLAWRDVRQVLPPRGVSVFVVYAAGGISLARREADGIAPAGWSWVEAGDGGADTPLVPDDITYWAGPYLSYSVLCAGHIVNKQDAMNRRRAFARKAVSSPTQNWRRHCQRLTVLFGVSLPIITATTTIEAGEARTCTVRYVHDADTFWCAETYWSKEGVRVWGIQAPELSSEAGRTVRDMVRKRLTGAVLTCRVRGQSKGRDVATCHARDGDLGGQLVRAGLACDWRWFSNGRYREAQRTARASKRGVWSAETLPPSWQVCFQ